MKMQAIVIAVLSTFFTFSPVDAVPSDKDRPIRHITLKTESEGDRRYFVGVGGPIDGKVNPDLFVKAWEVVEITLVNNDGLRHHIGLPDFFIVSHEIEEKAEKTVATFVPFKTGGFTYHCILDGHREMGMKGELIVIE